MNSRDNFTSNGVPSHNSSKFPSGHPSLSGSAPIPYNKPKTVSEDISEFNLFDEKPVANDNGTRIFNSVRSSNVSGKNNDTTSTTSAGGHFQRAENMEIPSESREALRSAPTIKTFNANQSPISIATPSISSVKGNPNGRVPSPTNEINGTNSTVPNAATVMTVNRSITSSAHTNSNTMRVMQTGAGEPRHIDTVPIHAMSQGSINNPASPVKAPKTTKIIPSISNINGARVNTSHKSMVNNAKGGRQDVVTASTVPSSHFNQRPSEPGVVRHDLSQNTNTTTRIMPCTGTVNGNTVNNSTTRIMPGISTDPNSVPGYNPIGASASQNTKPPVNPPSIKTINVKKTEINMGNTTVIGSIPVTMQNGKTAVMSAVHPTPQGAKIGASDTSLTKKKIIKKSGNPWMGILKFILYISFVIVISVLLARYFISVGNDVFAFVKDTYNFTDTVYSVKGETTNAFRVTKSELSGDRFEFAYAFKNPLSRDELDSLDASCMLIKSADNSVVHNYGKFTDDVSKGNPIVIDLSNADMAGEIYILRFIVNTGNNVSHITEFTVDKKSANINIKPNSSVADVAKALKSKGIIKHPAAFKLYFNLKTDDNEKTEFVAGSHKLYLGMDYDEIISAITPKRNTRSIVKLTFPEGSTVDDIISILIKGGVKNSKQDYIDAMEKYADFDYRFIDLLEEHGFSDERVYPLEGYLFPDTYEFYTDASPEAVLDKFLSNFNAKFDTSFYDEAERLGFTVDEIIAIASLVETEAGNPDDKGNISSVFHNRLEAASQFPYLESDATTDYASYDLKSDLKLTEYKCSKCGEKDVQSHTKCNKCGNNNSYEVYKCASFSIDLSKYDLIDGTYYINFNVRTDTTRSVALIDITRKTSGNKAVYTVSSKNVSDTPVDGNLKVAIINASVNENNILTCEFKLDHSFSSNEFMKFPIKLDLFRKAYNTYLTPGIMPSAVANPGYESIIAALYPNSTNYYFFVADNTGNSHFSTTNEEHNAKIEELERDGRSVTAN